MRQTEVIFELVHNMQRQLPSISQHQQLRQPFNGVITVTWQAVNGGLFFVQSQRLRGELDVEREGGRGLEYSEKSWIF